MSILPLSQGYIALVDEEDYERLKQFSWYIKRNSGTCNKIYAARTLYRNGWSKQVYLHHEVLGMITAPPGRVVDHINGNTLDCSRANLRICTHAENQRNRPSKKNSRSKYKGVRILEKKSGYRYQANIITDYKSYYLGTFKDEYLAMASYNVMAVKLHGKFAYLNTWNGPSISGEPDPLAEELAKIPHRDLVPYPHDPSEKLIYIYKFPPHEKNVRKKQKQ